MVSSKGNSLTLGFISVSGTVASAVRRTLPITASGDVWFGQFPIDHLIVWHSDSCVARLDRGLFKAAEKTALSSGSRSASVCQPYALACIRSSDIVLQRAVTQIKRS